MKVFKINFNEFSVHMRLQEELLNLEETEARLKAELESMHRKQEEIENSLDKFGNIEDMKAEIMEKRSV